MILLLTLKIVLIGDGNVGKTSLLGRFINKKFFHTYKMTIGAEFSLYQSKIGDQEIKTHIWDLAGQPFFSQVRRSYYAGAAGCLVVFDVTQEKSFESVPYWIKEALKHSGNDSPSIMLLGNKIDLRHQVPSTLMPKHGMVLAKEISKIPRKNPLNCKYIETSAKSGKNVEKAFKELIKEILVNNLDSELKLKNMESIIPQSRSRRINTP